jgi:tRNA A37 threonylcarbamoyladenosine dehydratase
MSEVTLDDSDAERRFGGLRRLYGAEGYQRLRRLHVAVVGLGGVGSWAVEALARSGVAALTLVDLDHVAESNINRQVQATTQTLGQHKGEALRERIQGIHPECAVRVVDAFVEPGNWPAVLAELPGVATIDGVIDACDQSSAKAAMAAWARQTRRPFVCVGAAGGKRQAQAVDEADLAEVTHDPLLAGLRSRLRREHAAPRHGRLGVRCVFSREAVQRPEAAGDAACAVDGSLNCAGYGSSVMVTASFGLCAASALLTQCLARNA